ncbi:transporter substrate-binding domain-containing protein [Brevibacillus massiliensis]|uniref:transporter substrate-binding domain-containing protein n=1 Tax=Brevibacillus massiliensis TaxID=1118054 RepID=UPI001C54BFF9|nr:transporter substrate-binding domain-containing protein [Brevibacillus massiliensis]
MMKKWLQIGVLLLAVVLGASVAACGANQASTGGEGAANRQEDGTGAAPASKVIVGTDTSYLPFEFLNQETGKYDGFDMDLLEAVSKEAGFAYELKPMDFSGLIPALQTHNLDMVIAGVTIKPERQQVIDFSRPYYDAGTLILVRADNDSIKGAEDLKGKVVATKQGTSSYDYAAKMDGVKEVVPFPNIDQAYMELEKGSADAVIFDSPNVLYYSNTKGSGKVKVVGDLLEGQQDRLSQGQRTAREGGRRVG